jgi:hypothetical protein
MTRFDQVEGWLGGVTAANYADGGMTHVAVPLRVQSASAEKSVALGARAAELLLQVADLMPDVHPVTDRREGAYALLCNVLTALQALEPEQLRQVLELARDAEVLKPLATMLAQAVVAKPPGG